MYQFVYVSDLDDDVVIEFLKEKEEDIEKSKPKEIDLTLPGVCPS